MNLPLRILGASAIMLLVACSFHSLSSPDAALALYLKGLKQGDIELVQAAYKLDGRGFYLPKPLPIDSFRVVSRKVFDKLEAAQWNGAGIVPHAEAGDVQLDVEETIDGKTEMFSYHLRSFSGRWRIYAHSGWDADT